jgi:hypothetical protein
MKSITNLWSILGSIGLAVALSACNGEIDTNAASAEATPASAEQAYTPIGRVIAYNQPISISSVQWWGGGDTDVYTQKNRSYPIYASASSPLQEPGKVTTRITYDVQESYKDFTHLHAEQDVTFWLPPTYRVNAVLSTASYFDLSQVCYYNHCWDQRHVDAPWYDSYGIIRSVDYWYDGDGRDDQGNAKANFVVQLQLDVTDL